MPKQRIRRTGGQPLLFEGVLLLKADNRRSETIERKQWHEVAIYRVDVGLNFEAAATHLSKVTYCCTITKEVPHEWAVLGDSPVQVLATYDPLEYLKGLPPGERYQEMDARLRAGIEADWRELLASVLDRWARLA